MRYCQKQTFMYRHFSSPLHSLKQTILETRGMTELLLLEYMKINPLPRVEQPSSKHHLYPFPVHKGSLCFPLGEKASGSCLPTQLGCSSRPSFCSCERVKLLLHSFLYFCLTFVPIRLERKPTPFIALIVLMAVVLCVETNNYSDRNVLQNS